MKPKNILSFIFDNREEYNIEIDNVNTKLLYQCNKNSQNLEFKSFIKSSDLNYLFEINNKMKEINDYYINKVDKIISEIYLDDFKLYDRNELSILSIICSISNKSILQNKDDDPLTYPILNLELIGGN